MRAALTCLLLTACGRLGFGEIDGEGVDAAGDALTIVAVRPAWLMPEGGRVEIELDVAVANGEVTVDGVPCTNVAHSGVKLACDAPAHAPGIVAVDVRADAAVATFDSFAYVKPGAFQHGAASSDRTSGVAIDRAGNVYLAGGTDGPLAGPHAGDFDAVLIKYNAAGELVWTRQLGTTAFDYARDVAVDPLTQSPTIVGYTAGALGAIPSAGGNDVFVARYTPDGVLAWVTQTGSPADDQAWDLAIDNSGATVAAVRTTGDLGAPSAGGEDYAVIRYTPTGAVDWIRQGGTPAQDTGHSITVAPAGTSYLVGYTAGALGGTNDGLLDLFVAELAADGTEGWIRQRGTPASDEAFDATVDASGDVWIAGRTAGALDGQPSGGGDDIFAMRFAPDGTWIHTRQYGGTSNEVTFGITVSAAGGVYVSCNTSAAFDGQTIIGGQDICVVAADRSGNHQWTRILGSSGSDSASSLTVDAGLTGFIYVSAITDASLDGRPNAGLEDIAVAKLDAQGAVR